MISEIEDCTVFGEPLNRNRKKMFSFNSNSISVRNSKKKENISIKFFIQIEKFYWHLPDLVGISIWTKII